MIKLKLNKILLGSVLLLGSAVSLSFSLTSCTKKNNDYSYDNDNTQYAVDGTNWRGYISGKLVLELTSAGDVHTAYVKANYFYTAKNLVIPKSVFSDDIEYDMVPTNFVLSSSNITGTIYIPPTFEFIGGSSDISINCPNADTVIIPEKVTTLTYKSINVKYLDIPNTVTSIDNTAFQSCGSLTSISIPNSVKTIGANTFYDCTSLTSVSIPSSVTSIGNYAFQGCIALASLVIPEGVTSIGSRSFYDCKSVRSFTIPSSLETIGDNICWNWTNPNTTNGESKGNLILPATSSIAVISNWSTGNITIGNFNFQQQYWNITKGNQI